MLPLPRLVLLAVLSACLAGCEAPRMPFARIAGLVTSDELVEISGLAASRGRPLSTSGWVSASSWAKSTLSTHQSYSGRWSSNSSVHSEWVMPSTASPSAWAKSYIG